MGSTLKGKNLLPMGANSFLKNRNILEGDCCEIVYEVTFRGKLYSFKGDISVKIECALF